MAGELGQRSLLGTRTQSTTTTTTETGTDAKSISDVDTAVTHTHFDNGFGFSYGSDFTWWGNSGFGVGASVFGAALTAAKSATVAHLNDEDPSTFKNQKTISGTTTTTSTLSDTTTFVTPSGQFGGGTSVLTMTVGMPAADVVGELSSTWTAGPGGATLLTLRQGDSAASNPKSNFKSEGGIQYATARLLWLNDILLHGDYSLIEGAQGRLALFGGLTVPVGYHRTTSTLRSVGDQGQGDTAKETEIKFQADGKSHTVTTETTLSNVTTATSLLLMGGPIIGISGQYSFGDLFGSYLRIGYAPALGGTLSTNAAVASTSKRVVTTAGDSLPAGVTAGTSTTESTSTTPSQTVNNLNGTETMAALGGALKFGPLRINAEAQARNYAIGFGPLLIYGIQTGVGLSF